MSVTVYGCRGLGNTGCAGGYLRETEFKISIWSAKAGKWRTKHRGLCRSCAKLVRRAIPGAAATPANPMARIKLLHKEKALLAVLAKVQP